MFIIPRIARALNHPGVAALLGVVLIAVGIFGLVSKDIPKWYSIVILVIGALNVIRLVPSTTGESPGSKSSGTAF